jgi:hypothetical protein
MIALSRIRWRINEFQSSKIDEQLEGEEIAILESGVNGPLPSIDEGVWNGLKLGSKEARRITSSIIEHEKGYFEGYKNLSTFSNFHSELVGFLRERATRLGQAGTGDFNGIVSIQCNELTDI